MVPLNADEPKYLSHYTSLAGLVGIVETRSLWASNVSFLNDKTELDHGIQAAKLAIQSGKKFSVDGYEDHLDRVVAELSSGKIPATYAVCFSEDSDNLSQWRGYSKGIQGVCLTFLRSDLVGIARSMKGVLSKVRYTDARKVEEMVDMLDDVLSFADIFGDVFDHQHEQKYEDIYKGVSWLIPQFKDYGFRDEIEHRVIVQADESAKSKCKFRVFENRIVPFIEVKFGKRVPVRSITVGPGFDQEITKRSIETFLQSREYKKVAVGMSSVPFRPSLV